MRLSLYARLALFMAVLFILLGLGAILLMSRATEGYRQESNQRLNLDLARNIVHERVLFHGGHIDRQALEHIFHMLMVINPRIEVYLLDRDGRILSFSAPPGKVQRSRVDLAPVRHLLDGPATLPLTGDDPRNPGRRKVFSAARVFENDQLRGYLYVILAGENYTGLLQPFLGSEVLRFSAAVLMAGLLFSLLAALLLFRRVTRPLRRLTRLVARLEQSDFREALPLPGHRGNDEIHQLWRACHAMTERIREQVGRLEQTDAQRRELIADVSHDLRTPLASLQGYLETLQLKQRELDPGQQHAYLRTALRHSRHLARLIEDLLELAKLEAIEFRPALEPFSLPELVQDIAQKFELRAREQGVQIRFSCDEPVPFVVGDIALIERVFDNLLVNALRHTPSGGRVALVVKRAGATVAVEIVDNGCGIAHEDLPHIFDRFYRPADRRGRDGAGLGLAIAQQILALHGGAIQARSAPGAGSRFAFELPAQQPPTAP